MDAQKLLEALNDIDERYVQEAEVYRPAEPERASPVFHALSWIGGLAACLMVLAGLLFLGEHGLLDPLETQSQLNSVPAVVSSTAEAESVTEDRAAVRLPELDPALLLDFPTREEVGNETGLSIGDYTEKPTETPLTREEIAGIWDQETLTWEGLAVEDYYDVTGFTERIGTGQLLSVKVELRQKGEPESEPLMTVEICPGRISSLGKRLAAPVTKSNYKDFWATTSDEVITMADYSNGQVEYVAKFLTNLFHGDDDHSWGVWAEAHAAENFSEEDMGNLMSRLANQCLRGGNYFGLWKFDQGPAPIEELPELDFSAVCEEFPETEEEGDEYLDWDHKLDDLLYYRSAALTEREIAIIFGQQSLAWEGLTAYPEATAYYDERGRLLRLRIDCYRQSREEDPAASPFFHAYILIDDLKENLFWDWEQAVSDIWGTKVETETLFWHIPDLPFWNPGDGIDEISQCKFQLHGANGETYTVYARAKSMGYDITDDEWYEDHPDLRSKLEETQQYLRRFVSQCLRPNSVFDPAFLTEDTLEMYASFELEEAGSITKDGTLYFNDAYLQGMYMAFGDGPDLEKEDAASQAGDDSCERVVNLFCAKVFNVKEQEDGTVKILGSYKTESYGFFRKDAEQHIRITTGAGGPGGLLCKRDDNGGLKVLEVLRPGDGTYFSEDVYEFCDGDEALAQRLMSYYSGSEDTRLLEGELLSYMEQNGLTGWKMIDEGSGAYYPFGEQ